MAILEANDEGGLYLPPEVIDGAKPHTKFRLEKVAGMLVITAEGEEGPFRQRATPEEWVRSFRQWANAPRPAAPEIPIEALRRENLYE
jgi:hypothetical protein